MVLKEDRTFAVSAANGSMTSQSPDGHGLWIGDTRFLSEYRLAIDGRELEARSVHGDGGSVVMESRAGALEVHRERFVDSGLHERITITNPGSTTTAAELELSFSADFAAMLAVRGISFRMPPPTAASESPTARGLLLQGSGGSTRATEVVIRPAGTRHHLELGPRDQFTITVDALPEAGLHAPDFDTGLNRIRDSYRSWATDCASFETDNPTLNELLLQSLDDMRMLCDRYPTGIYPTAGLPWFAVPFGRDALFTSLYSLPINPEIARGALRFLAAHQGRREDPATEEEPGKILHEVRTGEVVERGLWPHILYGTVDATPLYLCALAEAVDWTNDTGLFDELTPAAQAALDWCQTFGDGDGDGYLEYSVGIEARNEGWKDSNDSLTNVDGTDVVRPAALCEVQGYLHRGLLAMARLSPRLKTEASDLRRSFNRDFWIPRERFVAQALDGAGKRVEAISSNPGHCLWSGILSPAHAAGVAARLVSPEMFSGWGIRTLSTRAINYDARSYHNGSVWPHDCALAAAGLRLYGYTKEAELIARSVLEAGMAFPDRRLPELWCGDDRAPDSLPNDYRNSCSPQNWAAASTFSLIATLLGLKADARSGRLRIAPIATPLWNRLEVRGLHFAGQRLDLAVDGERVKLGKVPDGLKVELA